MLLNGQIKYDLKLTHIKVFKKRGKLISKADGSGGGGNDKREEESPKIKANAISISARYQNARRRHRLLPNLKQAGKMKKRKNIMPKVL